MNGSIGVATFSRPEELDMCLQSIVKARDSRNIPLIVLQQIGYSSVNKVILKWRSQIQTLIEVKALGVSPLHNINLNSMLLRNFAFDELSADWYLGVEEDIVIGGDSIEFIEQMMKKYVNCRAFRGVNLGSAIPRSIESENKYSRIRYGMHGQACAITKRTWNHFNKSYLVKNAKIFGLDAMLERYLKSGFMCWPHSSRYLDYGWNGTHTSKNRNDPYYQKLRDSYLDLPNTSSVDYIEVKKINPWRSDSTLYSKFTTPYKNTKDLLNQYLNLFAKFIANSKIKKLF
jgi:hypothetical protein